MNPRRCNRTLARMMVIMGLIGTIVIANVLFTMITKIHLRSGVNIQEYKEPSISNSIVLKGTRGTIYDRNGDVIAKDEDTYTIILIVDETHVDVNDNPAYVVDKAKTASELSSILNMKESEILSYLKYAEDNNLYQTELGANGKNLSAATKEKIEAKNLPGITFEKTVKRTYPTGVFASHLIGYAQYDEDTQTIEGVMGLESSMNQILKGENGLQVYQKDVNGNEIPGTEYTEKYAQDGNNVYLTLDSNVQQTLQNSLDDSVENTSGGVRGWGIVMEIETGKILGWASSPSFDLNKLNIENYIDMPSSFLYEPGSVMKGITYSAAIDSGNYPYDKTFDSNAFYYEEDSEGNIIRTEYGNQVIYDAMQINHGTITFDKGFVLSSNIGICELLSKYMSPSIYRDYIDKFGFLKKVETPYVDNEIGSISFTYASEKLSTGFGQAINITALQMVQAYSAILNDGQMILPQVVDRIEDSSGKIVQSYETTVVGTPISKETSEYMVKLLQRVVEDEDGTASLYKMNDVSIVAKTGTGQVATANGYDGSLYTSSVMMAAPADDPKVLVYYAFQATDYLSYDREPMKNVMRAALVAENITSNQTEESNTTESSYSKWEEYTMPTLLNHTLDYVNDKLINMNVNTVVIGNGSSVIRQYPSSGETVMTNQNVFVLTDGTKITMPDMSGWTKKDITAFWDLTGISVQMDGSGCVISQSIETGSAINADTVITVKMK